MRHLLRDLASCALITVSVLAAACSGADPNADTAGTSSDELVSGNAKTAFEFFVGKGLTEIQSAAIVGNLQQESSINPSSVQPGGPGRGIAQWSTGARWNVSSHDNVAWYAAQQGASVHSLSLQLEFIWYELENFDQYGLSSLQAATTVSTAVHAFQKDFEICGACNASRRVSYAQAVLKAYGSGS
jgi:Phage tail lysozyme